MQPQKQSLQFNFAQGLELKTDPKQLPAGKFLALENVVFNKGGLLQKRNGFAQLTELPSQSNFLTVFNNNLTAISDSILAYSSNTDSWVSKGSITNISLNTLPIIRSNTSQTQVDFALASNGLACAVYTDQNPASLSTPVYKYVVFNPVTGQNVISPTVLPNGGGTTAGSPRVFTIDLFFIIVYSNTITAAHHLQFIAININNLSATSPVDIASSYVPSTNLSFDAISLNNALYVGYNTTAGGQSIQYKIVTSNLQVSSATTFAGKTATSMSLSTDGTYVYSSFYDSVSQDGYSVALNQALLTIMAPVHIITGLAVANLTCVAASGVVTTYYEVTNAYSYDSSIACNYIASINVPTSTGTASSPYNVIRSVGLASKAFIVDGVQYFLAAYTSSFQKTYFLINASSSTQASPNIVSKLAYQNGGGYLTVGLPSAVISDSFVHIPYLYADLVQAVNKGTNLPAGSQVNGVYAQTGLNLVTFDFAKSNYDTVEIASALHIAGGFLWMYDGYLPVEHNFFLYPDNVEGTTTTTGGNLTAQHYYYQFVYEWSDNQGNIHRSAPSIPLLIDASGSGTSTNKNTLNIPTLRLTFKTSNPVKITGYRWSTAQQNYYQFTSITLPSLNDTTADSIQIQDTLADSSILGNNLIYTTGGVVEDIAAPASSILTLWQTRLFLVDSEDQNLLWFSKQVIENTPVEMSDLFTLYVAPTIGASGSTGPITALGAMDDYLIVFKKDAIYAISGSGPDNTGSNNLFSDPVFITSTVGCTNQQSIILTPMGLMFQSDKGIWLIDRGLNTKYIGAPVETFALASDTESAILVPGTNQVRFTLADGITLMYDYYYDQWATFKGIPGISSVIYQSLHTYLDSYGRVFQESPNSYVDGQNPVLIGLQTGWLHLGGISGYQRIYEFGLLGSYFSPHFLNLNIAYDYEAPSQQVVVRPTNYTGVYGSGSLYGQTTPYGGPGSLEQWRIHTQRQKCQAFQITLQEVFNPAYGTTAGQGFNLSGINCVVGVKSTYRPYKGSASAG